MWVPVGVGLLLLVGVLGVRGTTAADEEDLRAAAPPSVSTEPSADPSLGGDGEPGQAVLSAGGIDGLRLGEPATGLISPIPHDNRALTADDLPGGCMRAYESSYQGDRTWEGRAWLVDDVVASVLVTRSNPNLATPAGLSTWLGPTLGSPMEAASELPEARTTTERPFGPDGPQVTVVVAPVDGVEVVFSDAAYEMDAIPEQARGRVTTIEVRQPRARACSEEELLAFSLSTPEPPDPDPVLGLDGLTGAPIGSDATVLEHLPGARAEGDGLGGCQAFALRAGGGRVRVVALDGVVVSASVWGDVGQDTYGDLPFRGGMSAEEVSAAVPAGAAPPQGTGSGSVEVTLGQRVVQAELLPPIRWVEDVDAPVSAGPPAVFLVTVSDASVDPARIGC